jgi:hypothetical protein
MESRLARSNWNYTIYQIDPFLNIFIVLWRQMFMCILYAEICEWSQRVCFAAVEVCAAFETILTLELS